jgi:hypothetical protein
VIGEKQVLSGTITKFPAVDTQPLSGCSPVSAGELTRDGSSCNPTNPFSVSELTNAYEYDTSSVDKFVDSIN